MKKVIFYLIVILMCFNACKEKQKTEAISDFVGIWQLCGQTYGESMPTIAPYENERLPEYKIIYKDTTFANLIMSRNTFITVYGTYDDTKENKYIEYIKRSYTNPNHDNYINEMDCEMINGKYMKLTYRSDEGPNRTQMLVNEVWIKVPYGNPFKVNN